MTRVRQRWRYIAAPRTPHDPPAPVPTGPCTRSLMPGNVHEALREPSVAASNSLKRRYARCRFFVELTTSDQLTANAMGTVTYRLRCHATARSHSYRLERVTVGISGRDVPACSRAAVAKTNAWEMHIGAAMDRENVWRCSGTEKNTSADLASGESVPSDMAITLESVARAFSTIETTSFA